MVSLKGQNLDFSFSEKPILKELNVDVPEGKISVILGPNGSGKSTLLKLFARILKPNSGSIQLNGKDIALSSPREVAKNLSLMTQSPLSPEGITVRELVFLGGTHTRPFFQKRSKRQEAVEKPWL